MKLLALFPVASLIAIAVPAVAEQASSYTVTDTWTLGGEGGWDYATVDPATHRLFVARNDRVMVVDTGTGKLLAEIPGMHRAHGVALAPSLGKAFVSNGDSGDVGVIDLATLTLEKTFPASAKNPDAIVYDETMKRVITMNGGSNSISVIDPATGKVTASIALPGKPEFAAVDKRGSLWVNLEDVGKLVHVDLKAGKVSATWDLAPCESPSGLAFDEVSRRVFSVCDNHTMVVTDADDGHQVARLPIGGGPDAVVYDPSTHQVVSSNRDGTLSVFKQRSADAYGALPTVTTHASARTLALDSATHKLYLPFAQSAGKGQPVQGFGILVASPTASSAAQ
ncbi:MAG TPA: YncE family protein [Luteibacter sp.]|uniref:YncE family protein n=1 Tax=Luteibacter sp. TaxID=1886636 RepID=UPI002D09A4CB|nr:YncE family protein [Luteibacter sp.]HVI53789.1 YncE family protein [Luteibacter sp.]